MRTSMTLLSLFLFATMAVAQDGLPSAVSRQITQDTVAILRVDVTSLDAAAVDSALQDWPILADELAMNIHQLVHSIQKMKPLNVGELYLLVESTDLPLSGLLVAPTTNRQHVLEALKSVWTSDVEETADSVIAGAESVRQRARTAKPADRDEFSTALKSMRGLTLQVAIAPSADARRVLREILPTLPPVTGGGVTSTVLDGASWFCLGANFPAKLEFRMTVQAKDVGAAKSLHSALSTAVTAATKTAAARDLLTNPEELAVLLTPKLASDQVTLTLNEANGGAAKLVEQVVNPLADAARANATRFRTRNNLKHLGLAMHNYHDANKAFPPAAKLSQDGKSKLLSWRVLLLPFIDEKPLYDQFHLDESWDSPHNKTLIEKMPEIYVSSKITQKLRRQGKTGFLVPVGEKTVFENPKGTAMKDITDGTSNTIMIVDALEDRTTIWTKPDDLPFDPKDPWRGLSVPPRLSFWALICDGSILLMDNTSPDDLRRYFQMNDGEVIRR